MKFAEKIFSILEEEYPDACCELHYKTPFQLLIATILSAQCTDIKVNQVTKGLFKTYPNAKLMSQAPLEKLESLVHSTGFYKNKAKNILSVSKLLKHLHEGEVPSTLEELMTLPGVGRKTALVVVSNTTQQTKGIVVDTHVMRISQLLHLTKQKDPIKIEHELCQLLPKNKWNQISHLFIFHGRRICKARNPKCGQCVLNKLCPSKRPDV